MRDAPDDGAAWLARARTRATIHRFREALADLDAAGRHGVDRAALEAERAAILQAVGCYNEALVLRRNAEQRRPDFTALGALAVLQAGERGGQGGGAPVHRGATPLPGRLPVPRRRARLPTGADVARRARPPRGPRLVRRRRAPGAGLCAGAGSPRRGRRRPWRPRTPPSTACAPWRCPATIPSTRPRSPACSAMPAVPASRALAHQRGGPLRRAVPAPSGSLRRSRGGLLADRGRGSAERAPAHGTASRRPPRHRGTRTAPSRPPGRLTGCPCTGDVTGPARAALRRPAGTYHFGARSATPTTTCAATSSPSPEPSAAAPSAPSTCTTRTATTWSPTSTSPRTAGATSRARPVVALERGRPSIQVNISTAGTPRPSGRGDGPRFGVRCEERSDRWRSMSGWSR